MVKTLFKYEFKAYVRTLLPMQIILLIVAGATRLVQFLETDHYAYDVVFGSSVTALVGAMLFLLVGTVIFGISRYYKNLFSNEGYLSFTLPVTPSQHIFTKLVMFVTFTLMTVISIIIAVCIATSGEMLTEIIKAVSYMFKDFYEVTKGHFPLFVIELIIVLVIALTTSCLLFYTCMTIGQLAKKNRILLSFGVYFGYYMVCETIQGILLAIVMLLAESELAQMVYQFISHHPIIFAHTMLISVMLFEIVMGVVYYAITHTIIKKRLNLE